MANCCLTSWAVAGPKDKIQALADKMLALVNEGRTSLVALLAACRVRSIDLDLRSEFSSVSVSEDGVLHFLTDDSWYPKLEAMARLKKRFPGVEIYFSAEENGNGVFVKNDASGQFFPESYILDWEFPDDCDCGYFRSEEKAVEYFNAHFTGPGLAETVRHFNEIEPAFNAAYGHLSECWLVASQFEVSDEFGLADVDEPENLEAVESLEKDGWTVNDPESLQRFRETSDANGKPVFEFARTVDGHDVVMRIKVDDYLGDEDAVTRYVRRGGFFTLETLKRLLGGDWAMFFAECVFESEISAKQS